MMNHTAIAEFFEHFRLIPAKDATLLREVYRMRYEVYCEEMGFEEPERFPEGLEHDAWDHRARHCLLQHRETGASAGTVRLILHDPHDPGAPFPFEESARDSLDRRVMDPARMPRHRIGEISRLAVRADFRRRRADRGMGIDEGGQAAGGRRRALPIAVGLYVAGAALGIREGLSSVFVMMEPRLARHLSLCDIRFTSVGRVIDYRGRGRAAFHISRDDLLTNLSPPLERLLERMLDELGPTPAAAPCPAPARRTG